MDWTAVEEAPVDKKDQTKGGNVHVRATDKLRGVGEDCTFLADFHGYGFHDEFQEADLDLRSGAANA